MDILYLLIPLSVTIALMIGAAFWLAVDDGQFDDLEGPGLSVVVDDDNPRSPGPEVEGIGRAVDEGQTRFPAVYDTSKGRRQERSGLR